MFVDDEERIVRLLKTMFRSTYEVHTALSASEALSILQTVPVDVIASDQRMPHMTGIQLLSEVRQRWPDTIRLLLTGYSDLVAIIGAVNEGEVFRFLNKPWDQEELRSVIAEAVQAAQHARAARMALEAAPGHDDYRPQFNITSQLLAIDGVDSDRQEMVEMFTQDYQVHAASNLDEAITILGQERIDVVVTTIDLEGVADMSGFLEELTRADPALTIVVTTSHPQSDTIIKLINHGRIYRFAIKPLSPNIFRLAVNAAVREHHRRLADPRVAQRRIARDRGQGNDGSEVYNSFVESLGRFTKVS